MAARLGLPRTRARYRMERHGLLDAGEASGHRRKHQSLDRPGHTAPVRWQRSRVTFLQAQVLDGDGTVPDHERTRVRDPIAAKVAGFGGRIIEKSRQAPPTRTRLRPRDSPRTRRSHVAHAAFAVQRAVGVPHLGPPSVRALIALHTEEMLVGRLEDCVELDAGLTSKRAGRARRAAGRNRERTSNTMNE